MKLDFKFTKKKIKSYALYLAIIVLGIVIDQVTKFLAAEFLSENHKATKSIKIIGDFLRIRYTENRGMAFSMLSDERWVFMSISTLAIVLMLGYLLFVAEQAPLYKISVAIIASGGIGNMIDRVALGYVIDFVDVKYFAVFNGADSFVCVGAGLLALAMIIDIVKEYKKEKLQKENNAKE